MIKLLKIESMPNRHLIQKHFHKKRVLSQDTKKNIMQKQFYRCQIIPCEAHKFLGGLSLPSAAYEAELSGAEWNSFIYSKNCHYTLSVISLAQEKTILKNRSYGTTYFYINMPYMFKSFRAKEDVLSITTFDRDEFKQQ